MKTRKLHSGITLILLFIITLYPYANIQAQDQDAKPLQKKGNGTFNIPHYCLTLPLFDTLRPTVCNCGKGFLYYECILMKNKVKTNIFKYPEEEVPIMVRARFSELELETLNQNMLFINDKYQIQIKEWIRKEKWDLNLGEVVKGFYIDPIF